MRACRSQILHITVQCVARRSLQRVFIENRLQVVDRFIQRIFIEFALCQVPIEGREMLLCIFITVALVAVIVFEVVGLAQIVLRTIHEPADIAEAIAVLIPIRRSCGGRRSAHQCSKCKR